MAYVPTYTTQTKVDEHLGDEAGTCSEEEIRLAELDTDRRMKNVTTFDEDTGLKLTPADLKTRERVGLERALAEQIRYRRLLGAINDDGFYVPEYEEVSGPGFSRKGRRPRYSPVAEDYLVQAGLLTNLGSFGNTSALTAAELRDLYFEIL